ncbi:MAG: M23 family metallopeptidase [Rhodospirillales bacterium]|jgi:hypothetical protein|nr:M23 family metallopeptidase [Rhodospirillales bacterium]
MAGIIGARFSWFDRRLLALAIAMLWAIAWRPGLAAQPQLTWPMACVPGKDCWVLRHVDLDPSKGERDYACGTNTQDGHGGVDITLRDLSEMWRGVPVLAAADGVVLGIREGMVDINVRLQKRDRVGKKKCGNRVGIDHGGGWLSQYCHMRRGSIRVRNGQRVRAGQYLGLVGLSGATEFPHLHFQVRYKNKNMDPFVGLGRKAACGSGPNPLWTKATLAGIPYRRSIIFNTGFHDAKIDPGEVRAGRYRAKQLLGPLRKLFLWAEIWGAKPGDKVVFTLIGGNGKKLAALSRQINIPKPARFTVVVARSFIRKKGILPKGQYRGRIVLSRSGPAGPETYRVEIDPIRIR